MNPRFLEIARDPRIIPGVHEYCDEWCDRCGVRERCLAFRCTAEHRKLRGRRDGDPTFASMDEVVAFTRDLAELQGTSTEELDAMLSGHQHEAGIHTDDPLAAVAWEYAVRIAILFRREVETMLQGGSSTLAASRPEPLDVVLWYHLRIYMKLFRALVARERTAAGRCDRREDADGCAKLTLVSIQRSRAALTQLVTETDNADLAPLVSLLDGLERGIDDRFPGARAFIRAGLDVPVA